MQLLEADMFATPGFRLARFEIFNWGTFDSRIWIIQPNGDNALVTGDIGSGKSTLVDAMTTLLVPYQKITYNKAAGAESRERSLLSYVRGFYKSEKDDSRLSARSVGLRGADSYSVLLGVFHNDHYNETVTLAQVMWSPIDNAKPERFYVVSTTPLAIAADFANFGGNISQLKKRLRNQDGVEVFDSFNQYGSEFRRRMGISGEQVLDLFYQTVSMKSVDNITDFVRKHMLEPPSVNDRIDALCRNFENLRAAYDAVLKAKDQINRLSPLIIDCDRHDSLQGGIIRHNRMRDALGAWSAQQKSIFLAEDLKKLAIEIAQLQDAARIQNEKVDELYQQQADLKQAIGENGGRRLEGIANQISILQQERDRQRHQFDTYYAPACTALELPRAQSLDTFHANRRVADATATELNEKLQQLTRGYDTLTVKITNLNQDGQSLADEIRSLATRTSSIPSAMLALRAKLCATLGISEQELPFAGELIQVRPEETAWEGAIERVLRSFGLSLLVSEEHHAALATYVDRQHLGERLVYFGVRDDEKTGFPAMVPGTLPEKLEFKPDSRYRDWLRKELARVFDYACCETIEEFRRQPKALTQNGQTKSGGIRHEKDDRSRVNDRTRYILGWRNEEKIRALEEARSQIEQQGHALIHERTAISAERKKIDELQKAIHEIMRYADFRDLDWAGTTQLIHSLEEEKRQLESSSDVLRELNERLSALEDTLEQAKKRRSELDKTIGNKEHDQETKQQERKAALDQLAVMDVADREYCFPLLDSLAPEALGGHSPTTARQCDEAQPKIREWLKAEIDKDTKAVQRLIGTISSQMQDYRNTYPAECREFDASLEAAGEYRKILSRLQDEDLPRFEARFKSMLNEQTINEVALLQNKLDQEAQDIEDKIRMINRSLRQLDYNPGTFIQIMSDSNNDPEVLQFKQDLRACLADSLTSAADDLYSEHKFLQVKQLIDRFQGREGLSELDRNWRQKVSDVRNWYLFSASELWREDETLREFYSDSSGKSGGQKEKLAYTILASALVYQYGIEQHASATRSFRFVMIDEAFGRGSDESARYGLELFRQLGLQLLIVTPLQKIHVIEDYVKSVHLVHNRDGRESMIRSLTIDEFAQEKAKRQA